MQNPLTFDWSTFFPYVQERISTSLLYSKQSILICVGWLAFQVLMERFLPGEVALGVPLSTGERLKYPLNGHLAFWVAGAVMTFGDVKMNEDWSIASLAPLDLAMLYDEYMHLITVACVISFLLAIYLYVSSFKKGALLAGE